MKKYLISILSVAIALLSCPAEMPAYNPTGQKATVSVGGSIDVAQSLTVSIVRQNKPDNEQPILTSIGFGGGPNRYQDSGAALKVSVNTNIAGNRVIIYTNNTTYTGLRTKGQDGGGLLGASLKESVPLVWALSLMNERDHTDPDKKAAGIKMADSFNGDYPFDWKTGKPGANKAAFISDLSHQSTYVDAIESLTTDEDKDALDNLDMRYCKLGTTVFENTEQPPHDLTNPQVFPQFFGGAGVDRDLCNASGSAITIGGKTFQSCSSTVQCDIDDSDGTTTKVSFAEEISKNSAVVAYSCFPATCYGCSGTTCNVPNFSTPLPSDFYEVTGPLYLPIGADFRFASGQSYSTSTLTVELVTQ